MASKKKGLSMEEKRAKMLELFYESKEFFQMKELEKIAPKQKGVISQSVKEITEMLVDEGLVEREKIGTFVCYWAFPSKALQLRKRKLEELEQKFEETTAKLACTETEVALAKQGKEESAERTKLLAAVGQWKARLAKADQQLDALSQYDPAKLEDTKVRTEKAREDANRWTDNIFSIKKWCKCKFGMDEKTLDKQFEINPEMDYIE